MSFTVKKWEKQQEKPRMRIKQLNIVPLVKEPRFAPVSYSLA